MATIQEAQYATDYETVLRHSALKGFQVGNLITTPIYIVACLGRRQPILVNRLLRSAWIGSGVGTLGGALAGWGRLRNADAESVRDRRVRLAYNKTQIRTDDHSTIGMILGATLTPALFWKRARAVHLILGGAALGSGVGILTHLYRSYTEGEDIKPEGMRDIAEGVIEGPKR